MDIQFTLEQQSLETLCFHFIVNQTQKSRNLITNSILLHLASNPSIQFYQIFQLCQKIVDENCTDSHKNSMTDKQYRRNMVILLKEIAVKYPNIIKSLTQTHLNQIVKFSCSQAFCAVAGNDFIALVALLSLKIKNISSQTYQIIEQTLMNQKMHIGSYRQTTRLNLYTLLMTIIGNKKQEQLTSQYINSIIRLIEDEKDPRNISSVFRIYALILSNALHQNLQSCKKKIFDGLEMYYPIDFEGDTQQHNIRLGDISALLDQCLTNPIFQNQLRGLLTIKMGAAPVAKYIATFIATRNHTANQPAMIFWVNLLLRTSEQQYLSEQYQQNSKYTLSSLVVQLLTRVCTNPMPLSTYKNLERWLYDFIKTVLDTNENSKHAHLIIMTLKEIMSKCNTIIKDFVANFVLYSFICMWDKDGDILYKLGLLIPILQSQYAKIDGEKIGLLILTLSKLYHKQKEQIQPNLLILKLFMILCRNAAYFKMISKTNIHLSCIQLMRKWTSNTGNQNASKMGFLVDNTIIKAHLDYLIQIFPQLDQVQNLITSISSSSSTNEQVRLYGLITLANKVPAFFTHFRNMISDQQNRPQMHNKLLVILPTFKLSAILNILNNLPTNMEYRQVNQICHIVNKKFQQLQFNPNGQLLTELNLLMNQKQIAQSIDEEHAIAILLNRYKQQGRYIMAYYLKNRWRIYAMVPHVNACVKQLITKWNQECPDNQYLMMSMAYYNKSCMVHKLPQMTVNTNRDYEFQQYRMLPIEPTHPYTAQQCRQWPTLVHYSWTHPQSKQLNKQLIPLLPNSILTQESDKILPAVLATRDMQTISKILKQLAVQQIVQFIIPFVVGFLADVTDLTQVQHIVAANRILFDLEDMTKTKEDQMVDHEPIRHLLLKYKGKILVAIEERLLQHRKRRARQSSRTIFSLYNSMK